MQRDIDLWDCAEQGEIELAKEMLEEYPTLVNEEGYWRRLPLHYACITGNVEMVKLFLEYDVNVRSFESYYFECFKRFHVKC
jgi:ankyrin repeat protein